MWIVTKADELYHIGMPRRSGRYPFGSGKRPFQGLEESLRKKKERKEIEREVKKELKASKQRYKSIRKNKRTMSDEELRNMIQRLKLEKELDSLMKENLKPAQSELDRIIKNVGTDTITKFGKKASYWTLANIINHIEDDAAKDFPSLAAYMMKSDKK
jgi:molecular chaperone DnaK (HSP70)